VYRTFGYSRALQESLDVELQNTNWVLELILLQHGWVENTEGADDLVLAGNANVDGTSVAREVGSIYKVSMVIRVSFIERGRTISLLDIIVGITCGRVLKALLTGDEGALEHGHDAVKKTVDNLKATALAVEGSSEVSLVATLALHGQVLEGNIADLEDPHGNGMVLVLTNGLQETREQASADNLEFGSLGVGQLDGGVSVILAVQPTEVLIVRAQDEGHHFRPTSHGSLHANDIGKLVDGKRLSNCAGDVGECARKRVETVSNGHIFHDITLMENIGTGWGDFHIDDVRRNCGGLGAVRHLCELVADLSGAEFQATALVDVRDFSLRGAGSEIGGNTCLVIVFRHNLDGLDGEGLRGVLGEHSNHHPVHNLELCAVEGCDFNENIGGVQADLGAIAVDNRGQGANIPLRVVDNWVNWRVANDGQVLAQLLVLFVEVHQFLTVHLLGLVQRSELDVLRGLCLISEGALDSIQIVRTD